jgi:hypothetical protein
MREKVASGNGLMSKTRRILDELYNIENVVVSSRVRGYKGHSKVRLPKKWPRNKPVSTLVVAVCDGKDGERDMMILTSKPGAIQRILGTRLMREGVYVC